MMKKIFSIITVKIRMMKKVSRAMYIVHIRIDMDETSEKEPVVLPTTSAVCSVRLIWIIEFTNY